jgi:hypothetical protein
MGVTGLVGWLVEGSDLSSLVRFFLRNPRLGMCFAGESNRGSEPRCMWSVETTAKLSSYVRKGNRVGSIGKLGRIASCECKARSKTWRLGCGWKVMFASDSVGG